MDAPLHNLKIALELLKEFNSMSRDDLHKEMNELIGWGEIPKISNALNIRPDTIRSYVKKTNNSKPSFENYIRIKAYSLEYLSEPREAMARKKEAIAKKKEVSALKRKERIARQKAICAKRKEGFTCEEVAKMFSVSKQYVSNISRRNKEEAI